MRDAKEDPNLAEVKAVLKKLQRLDLPSGGDIEHRETGTTRRLQIDKTASVSPARSGMDVFDRKHAAIAVRPAAAKQQIASYVIGAAVLMGAAAALFASGIIKLRSNHAQVQPAVASVQHKEGEAVLLIEARRLLNEGDVAQARARLLNAEPVSRAELAFMLAQSYDPNYLRALPKSNGLPDRDEAGRWYKKWYDLAISSGLEMDNERLKRIINAMQ